MMSHIQSDGCYGHLEGGEPWRGLSRLRLWVADGKQALWPYERADHARRDWADCDL